VQSNLLKSSTPLSWWVLTRIQRCETHRYPPGILHLNQVCRRSRPWVHPKGRGVGTELSDAAPAICAEGIEDRLNGRSSFEGNGRGAYSSTLSFVSWFGLWFLSLSIHQVREAKCKVEDDNAAELLRRLVVVHTEGLRYIKEKKNWRACQEESRFVSWFGLWFV
jgi:hypothetical protein